MRVGRYSLDPEAFASARRIAADAARVRETGIPRALGETPEEIARAVLADNARDVMRAGAGHFHLMWTADLGKAFEGALTALPREYLAAQVSRIVRASVKARRVPTCFSANDFHEIPWERSDNLPWLLHMVDRLDDAAFLDAHRRDLVRIYADWVERYVDARTGLIRRAATGDWMDTVPRPSSTYANLCALRAYEAAERIGIHDTPTYFEEAQRSLLGERWSGRSFRDHGRAGDYLSADANVPALYFGFLPGWCRRDIVDSIEASRLCDLVPMRTREGAYDARELPLFSKLVPSYHSTCWTHLGFMYVVGLQREERPYSHHLARLEGTVRAHGNFLETLDGVDTPHATRFMATEYGFTMSAGLYLEALVTRRRAGT